jgi:hypothetical protein
MADYDSSLPVRTETAGDVDIFISDATTSTQKLQVNADGSAEVNQKKLDATTDNVAISDGTNSATVNVSGQLLVKDDDLDASTDSVQANLKDGSGNDYTASNPLPVVFTPDGAGDEIVDFNTSAAVAKDASVNHDYTVSVGKSFIGEEAWVSGSGKLKVELLINGATSWVGFNSTSNPNVRIPLEKMAKAGATEVIRFTITNRDNQAQDVYSTLTGSEV